MKTAMKLTNGILAVAIAVAGGVLATKAVAQETDAIDQARSIAKSLQQKQANDSNAALDAAGVGPAASDKPAPTSEKPAPGAPAPAVRPAVIPGSNPAPVAPAPAPAAAKPVIKLAAPAAKASASSAHSQLQRVNVTQSGNDVRVEMVASGSVTPKVSKLDKPARVLVELPETAAATSQNHIAFGNAGVKGVRVGMDGKNPPTTSVVIDLEKSIAYELSPSEDGKVVLTLHTQGGAQAEAKNTPAPAKSAPVKSAPAAQPKAVAKDQKPADTKQQAKAAAPAKPASVAASQPVEAAKSVEAPKPAEPKKEDKKEDKKWAMNGKRDPFFSPVVQQNGSGCSTGKKCLEIGNINLRGVVKSDNGFIAVVTNNLNKAYFLRENDPVFNGFVVKITGDSVVFSETIQDKLGKPFTREVVKRIFTPAV